MNSAVPQPHTASPPRRDTRSPLQRLLKGLELAWRRGFFRVLAGIIWLSDRLPRGPRVPGPQRVLFLRPDRIGDMIVSTGVIRAIGGAADTVLDVLAAPANATVLSAEPAVRRVHVLNRRRFADLRAAVRTLRRERYDVVVDCMPTAPSVTILLLVLAIGARRRVGTRGRGLDHILNPATPALPLESHIVDHLSLLVPPFRPDADTLDLSPVLVLTSDERASAEQVWEADKSRQMQVRKDGSTRLLVNISAGKAARWWPASSYAAVVAAARAARPELQVLIMCAPNERDRAEELAQLTGAGIAPSGNLRAAMAIAGAADVVFTPDTSIAHAAGALGVPVVDMLLFGKESGWGVYRPLGENMESPTDQLQDLAPDLPAAALVRVLSRVAPRLPRGHTAPATSHPAAS